MNWYDYKMACVVRLMKKDMHFTSDEKGISIFKDYKNGYPPQNILNYKRSVTWKKFHDEILPKILGETV